MPTVLKTEPSSRRFSLGLGHGVFLLVLVVRLITLIRLTHSGLLIPSRGDMHFYNDWARQILHGQFTQPLAFYGLPGYAYLLAALGRIFGENPFVPGFLQALLDGGTAVLIYQIYLSISDPASLGFRRVTGLVAGVGWTFFVPAEAYSIVLMPTAWFVFVFWFVVWRLVRNNSPLSRVECLLLALLVGLTATAVATVLAVVPLMLAGLILKKDPSGRHPIWARIGILLIGLILGTSPCWIHNYFIARDPVPLSAHSGINFWIGNNPEANGYPRFPPGLRAGQAAMLQDSIDQAESAAGHPLKHSEVSAYWSGKAKTFITHHFNDWVKLIGVKLRNFWNAFQYDDLSIITILREQNVILPGIYFGIIAALAIPGILLASIQFPKSRWILTAIALSMIALLAVFITERYRLVAVPGLLIFAALGLSILWHKLVAGEGRMAASYVVVLYCATRFVAWPQRDPSLWALDAYNAGWQALESNNLSLAEKKLAIAHAYVPQNSETLFALGNLRLAQNNPGAASAFYFAVLNVDPKHKGAFNNLGVIALDASEFDTAEAWFHLAENVDPQDAKTHYLLARTLLAKNDTVAADAEIGAALALKSGQPEFIDLKNKIDEQKSQQH
jgi:Flp pilus assembly protein TadD